MPGSFQQDLLALNAEIDRQLATTDRVLLPGIGRSIDVTSVQYVSHQRDCLSITMQSGEVFDLRGDDASRFGTALVRLSGACARFRRIGVEADRP